MVLPANQMTTKTEPSQDKHELSRPYMWSAFSSIGKVMKYTGSKVLSVRGFVNTLMSACRRNLCEKLIFAIFAIGAKRANKSFQKHTVQADIMRGLNVSGIQDAAIIPTTDKK